MSIRANGDAIRIIRERSGLTLRTLATSVRVSEAQMSRIETGASYGSPEVLRLLADRLDVPLGAITSTSTPARLRRRPDRRPAGSTAPERQEAAS